MPENDSQNSPGEGSDRPSEKDAQHPGMRVPQGFTVHSSGLASEYARELGWGINEDERKKTPKQKQDYDGGRNFDYGAQDFDDTAKDTSTAQSVAMKNKPRQIRQRRSAA